MGRTKNIPPKSPQQDGDDPLQKMLAAMSASVGEYKEEIDFSHGLYTDAGAKTELASTFEKIMDNPIAVFIEKKDLATKTLRDITRLVFQGLLTIGSKKIIDSAFLLKQDDNSLLYGIILKEDKYENRRTIFRALDAYENTELSEHIPVTFQIIPKELADKITNVEKVI